MSVSVCLPARNEEATIGAIVAAVVGELVDGSGLVDEVVVVDDGSTDDTMAVAAEAGALVVAAADVLPEMGPGTGKGEALWKAVYAAEGDILVFLDADLRMFDTRFVTALLAALDDERVMLVKGRYRRDLDGAAGQGGRVTELVARPLIDLFFPQLSAVSQPLGGEFAARRCALEAVPFAPGYGVDLALLVDVAATFGVDAIAQAELGPRTHRNRPLDELREQARTVLATGLARAGVTRGAESEKSAPADRPPMIEVPSYLVRRTRRRGAGDT